MSMPLNSVFSNTQGTRPMAGIDLEPDDVQQRISNVRIHNSKFLTNAGPGIPVAADNAADRTPSALKRAGSR